MQYLFGSDRDSDLYFNMWYFKQFFSSDLFSEISTLYELYQSKFYFDEHKHVYIFVFVYSLNFYFSRETQRHGLVFVYDMSESKYSNFDYELSIKILNMLKVSAADKDGHF